MVKPDSTVADKNERKGKYKKKMYSHGYFYKNRKDPNIPYNKPYINNAYQATYNSNFIRPKHFQKNNYNSYKFDRRKQAPFAKTVEKEKPPPLKGSEEYTLKKIEETSKLIMQAILNPQESCITSQSTSLESNSEADAGDSQPVADNNDSEQSNAAVKKNVSKPKRKMSPLEQKILHEKIMSHISNLNDSRKKNLINSRSSEYDGFIQQIQKQKRLEISRALRDMVGQDGAGPSGFFNSIIPDIGVELNNLPKELIDQLHLNLGIIVDDNDVGFDFHWQTEMDDFTADNDIKFDPSTFECTQSDNKSEDKYTDLEATEFKIKEEIVDPADSINNSFEGTQANDMKSVVTSNPNFALETNLTPKDETNESNIRDSSKFFNPNFKKKYKQIAGHYYLTSESIDKLTDSLLLNGDRPVPVEDNEGVFNASMNQDFVIFEEDSVRTISAPSQSKSATETSKQVTFPANSEQLIYFENSDHCTMNKSVMNNSQSLQVTFADEMQEQLGGNEKVEEVLNVSKDEGTSPTPTIVSLFQNTSTIEKDKTQQLAESDSSLIQSKISTTLTDIYPKTKADINKISSFTDHLRNFIKRKSYPSSLKEAIEIVTDIDEAISILATFRKDMLLKLTAPANKNRSKKRNQRKKAAKKIKKNTSISAQKIVARSDDTFELKTTDSDSLLPRDSPLNNSKCSLPLSKLQQLNNCKILQFKDISEKMLVVQRVADQIVAASESGSLFSFSCASGDLVHQVQVASNPITAICTWLNMPSQNYHLYVSSIDSLIRIYDLERLEFVKDVEVGAGMRIQCMEQSWGFIFIGTSDGMLNRYNIASGRIEFSDPLELKPIFAIKATKEGARRVLLVGTRNEEVAVRDAGSGLLLRRLVGQESTVYSIVIHNSLVYCGTTNKNILVYSFHEGNLLKDYDAANCKGISSMKVERNLLFASSFNGIIYVYNLDNDKLVGSLEGPGGVILCMEIYKNQIIIGTMKFHFVSIPIPFDILKEFIL